MIELGCACDGGKDSLSMAAAAGGETVMAPGNLVVSAYVGCPDITKVRGVVCVRLRARLAAVSPTREPFPAGPARWRWVRAPGTHARQRSAAPCARLR
jgi:hypothetical protein